MSELSELSELSEVSEGTFLDTAYNQRFMGILNDFQNRFKLDLSGFKNKSKVFSKTSQIDWFSMLFPQVFFVFRNIHCRTCSSGYAADCFRLAGNKKLQKKYTEAAREAYKWAMNQPDKMLSTDVSGLRGKDLKMTAAAFLYNLTGEKSFETEMKAESEVQNATSKVRNPGKWEQQFAAIAYLFTPKKVNYPELQENLKKAIINQAKNDYLHTMNESPTKAARWSTKWEGMAQTSNEMSLVAVAHKLTDSKTDKAYFEKGMYAEAEWTLGRNPLGLVQMTGLGDRSLTQTFAPGRRDGYPNVTPGWTPYMCRDGFMKGNDIHGCEFYTTRNYPEDKEIWPWGEHFWNSRYSVPNSEATPQQTFRQKIVLYGYLYGMKTE